MKRSLGNYRDASMHVGFADRLFQSITSDRISIDYLES